MKTLRQRFSIRIPVLDVLKTAIDGKSLAHIVFVFILSMYFIYNDVHVIFNLTSYIGILLSITLTGYTLIKIAYIFYSPQGRHHVGICLKESSWIEKILSLIIIVSAIFAWWYTIAFFSFWFLLYFSWPKTEKLDVPDIEEHIKKITDQIDEKLDKPAKITALFIFIIVKTAPHLALIIIMSYALYHFPAFTRQIMDGSVEPSPKQIIQLLMIGGFFGGIAYWYYQKIKKL